MAQVQSTTFTILNGETESNIVDIPNSILISTFFIPSSIQGTTLSFNVDIGDGAMNPLNFSFNLDATPPETVYKGYVSSGFSSQFTGIKRLQLVSDVAQLSDVEITAGYTF